MADETFSIEDFKLIPGQTGPRSARVLLSLQATIVAWATSYSYLEIGSFAGRSIHPHIRCPDCTHALSVDLRPDVAQDERGPVRGYEKVTAEMMIANLQKTCREEELAKLETITGTSNELRQRKTEGLFDLAFIDGEHTVRGVVTDFLNVLSQMKEDAIIAFDDTRIVFPAIEAADAVLEQRNIKRKLVFARHNITFFQLGAYADRAAMLDPRLIGDVNAARKDYFELIRSTGIGA